jgi:hypothetical protein
VEAIAMGRARARAFMVFLRASGWASREGNVRPDPQGLRNRSET